MTDTDQPETGPSKTVLRKTWDPLTLRPVFDDRRAVGERLDEIAGVLSGVSTSGRRVPNEFSLQFESLELYLWLGRADRARALANGMLGRARRFRLTNQIALAEAVLADLRVWEGDFVGGTLDLIEVTHRARHEGAPVQAAIRFRLGRCEFVQHMWADAAESFAVAVAQGKGKRLIATSPAELRFAARCAAAHLAQSGT